MEKVVIDAENKSLGRLATEIAYYLQGKHCKDYQPNIDRKVFVLIKNLDKAKFTGKKFDHKFFVRHSGYLGHRQELPLKIIWTKNKLEVIKNIVKRMIPKNKLRKKRLARIKIFLNHE